MECEMVIPIGERPQDGWRKWRCARCNRESSWSPHVGKQLHYHCNGIPRTNELGNWVELLLEVFFIRKHGWQRLKAWLGMSPQCGCQRRQDRLNSIGERIHDAASKARDRVVTAIRILFQATLKGYRWLLRLAGG